MISIVDLHMWFRYSDGCLLWRKSPAPHIRIGDQVGTLSGKCPYLRFKLKGKNEYVHRAIFAMHYDYWPTQTDHINRNKTDNRINNLREVTVSQNGHNRGPTVRSKTGVKGVTPSRHSCGYQARKTINGNQNYIGTFPTITEAKEALEKWLTS